MDEIIIDPYMINAFCIINIILLISISIFQYIRDLHIINDIQIKNTIQKITYIFISYILVFQGAILYHINNLDYSISGSESVIITENQNTNSFISFIILISIILSLLITCFSVKLDNNMIRINDNDINI